MDDIQQWIDRHDELSLENGEIYHDGSFIGSVNQGSVSFRAGLRGTATEIDDEWLIVDGSRTVYRGPDEGRSTRNGKFAVRPWTQNRPEIDGPLP